MSADQISIINVQEMPRNAETEEDSTAISANQISTTNSLDVPPIVQSEEGSEHREIKDQINKASYWNLLHVISMLGPSTFALSPQLLIPRHNSIYYPNFRHEFHIISSAVGVVVLLRTMRDFVVFTKEKSSIKISVMLKLFLGPYLVAVVLFYSAHYFWTVIMGYQHPMPFLGIFIFLANWIIYLCTIWSGVMFPSELRENTEFNGKIKAYLMYDVWWFVINVEKDALSVGFKTISGNYQFIFALLIPAAKEMNKRVLSKLVARMVGNEDERANVLFSAGLNIHYAFFVALRMNGAETLTIVCIVVVDFLLQLWMVYQIIQLNPKVTAEVEQKEAILNRKDKAIKKLVLAELAEGLVPLVYAIGFAMAYYGPNGHLVGNVLTDLWAYEKVEDVVRLFTIQLLLFGVDCITVALNTALLSKFGNVNLIQEFSKVLKGFWIILAISLVLEVTLYFAFNDVNFGRDMEMKFEWITTEGRLKFISNSTDLSYYEKAILLSNSTIA